MKIPVFLSYSKPFLKIQQNFISEVEKYLNSRDLEPRTLGVTDYDMDEPLITIRRLMLECNGVLTIAFRKARIDKGVLKPESDLDDVQEIILDGNWITSPYCHIEPAMAFQIGLPILIFREKGVINDGVLEHGVTGTYLPEFDLQNDISTYFNSDEWKQLLTKWEHYVRSVALNKGLPPKRF